MRMCERGLRTRSAADLSGDGGDEAAAHDGRRQVAQELADERVLVADVLFRERDDGRRDAERRLLLVHEVDELDDAVHHALVLSLDQRPRAVHHGLHARNWVNKGSEVSTSGAEGSGV